MPAKQLPIPVDLEVLRVIAHRHVWLLVILTFLSFAFSSFITLSLINMYSASITIYVDPESVLGDIAQGVALNTSLRDQLSTLQHLIRSDDFLEPHVIQELGLRYEDLFVPPFKLKFMPAVLEVFEDVKNGTKRLFGLPTYDQTDEQQQYLRIKETIELLKNGIGIRESRGRLLIISFEGRNPTTCRKIVEILANQCKELLLRNKNQETREALRYIERQYNEATRKLEQLERELADMRVEQFDKGPEAKIALLKQRQDAMDALRVLEKDLETIDVKKQELIKQQEERENILRGDPAIIEELAKIAKSQEAVELETVKQRLKDLRQIYTDEWPEIKDLKQRIADMEDAIQTRIESDPQAEEKIFLADPIYREYFSQIAQLETQQKSLQEQRTRLNDNIAIYEDKIKGMPEIEKSFTAIQRKIGLQEKLQMDLAQKLQTAQATMQLEKTRSENRIRAIARSFPTKPSGLPTILVMPALCLLGPIIGVGIIGLLYYINTSVKSAEDVQKEYNLPVIAIIPKTNFRKELKHYQKRLNTTIAQSFPATARKDRKSALVPLRKRVLLVTFFIRMMKAKLLNRLRKPSQPLSSPLSGVNAAPGVPEPDMAEYAEVAEAKAEPEVSESLATQNLGETEIDLFDKTIKRIPMAASCKSSDELLMVTMLTNPDSQAAEEYRRLCFNVEWGLKESLTGSCKTLMVVSALPGEGKTITALNLATTLARNHRVLFVETNFRKPAIYNIFGLAPEEDGLSDMIAHNINPNLYVIEDHPNLSILPAGSTLTHPADLLSSKEMTAFIESVKSSPYFEYAIFDVPPILRIPDSSIVASKVDGIVWVIHELRTSREIVRMALTRLTNPAILGVVLNNSEQRALPRKYNKIWKDYQRGGKKPHRSIL
jgi:capsular exopolysaccharide synthesis family protein